MKISELQTQFYKEKGIEAFNSQGEPDIDYVQWLEDKITKPLPEQPVPHKSEMLTFLTQNVLINLSSEQQIFFAKDMQERFLKPEQPVDFYSGDLNATRIKKYKNLAAYYNLDELTVGKIFCDGIDFAQQQSVAQSSPVVKLPEIGTLDADNYHNKNGVGLNANEVFVDGSNEYERLLKQQNPNVRFE